MYHSRQLQRSAPYFPAVTAFFLAWIAVFCSCSGGHQVPASRKGPQELITDLLHARDEQVRAAAARRLGKIREHAATQPLISVLDGPGVELRLAAVNALGEINDPAAVPPLCVLLKDYRSGRMIKIAALRALTKLRDPQAATALVGALPEFPQDASMALVALGESAIPALTAGLRESEVRPHAAPLLATLGSPAVPPLIETLRRDRSKFVRLAAATALSEIPDPDAAAALEESLKSADLDTIAASYRYWIRKGQPGTEGLLMQALSTYGTLPMAEDFAASGNTKLAAHAMDWAKKNTYLIARQDPGKIPLRWGERDRPHTQLALFHYDNSIAPTSGPKPLRSSGIMFVPGKWGSAVAVAKGGVLSYPAAGVLDLQEGTIEMWISPRVDGSHPTYVQQNHPLLLYQSAKGDQFLLSGNSLRGFYAGSVIRGKFAGTGGGDISAWKAGEWHHVAFTYSARESRQRFYLDGLLTGERKAALPLPASDGTAFTVGGDTYGNWTGYAVDELRLSNDEKSPDTILYDASRKTPFADGEIRRSLTGVF